MTHYMKPSPEVLVASRRNAIREQLLELLTKEKKGGITVKCGVRAMDLILNMPECNRSHDEYYLIIASCIIYVVLDFELDPFQIVYNNHTLTNE